MRRFGLAVALIASLVGCTAPDQSYCANDDDCVRITGLGDGSQICHQTRHICLSRGACASDADCLDPTASRCDPANSFCVPCLYDDASDMSCRHFSGKPACGRSASGVGECVACLVNLDCPASTPICDGKRCRTCQQHSDCAGQLHCEDDDTQCSDSLVCIMAGDLETTLSGRCAKNGSAGRVLYVRNDAQSCSASAAGTDVDHPFCGLDDAYVNLNARTFLRVLAGSDYMLLNNPSINAGQVIFVGAAAPSRGIDKPATITFPNVALGVFDQAKVTLDGFTLHQTGVSSTIVNCQGKANGLIPSLTLRNNTLSGSTPASHVVAGAALELKDCVAKISGNVIGVSALSELENMHLAHSRALHISNTSGVAGVGFVIENNVIAGNWSYAIDLDNVNAPGISLGFNTIVGNVGGMRCPFYAPNLVQIANSIIWNNSPGGSQFSSPANCHFTQTVVGSSDTAAGLLNLVPALGEAFDLPKNAANSACCIDHATSDETSPRFDIRGIARPQGTGWDIGAYELPVM